MKSTVLVIVHISLMLLLSRTTQASLAKPGCQERCGNITVPYPYGIGTGCYLHKSFEVICIGSSHDLAPLRFVHNHEFPIIGISMESLRVLRKPDITCNNSVIMPVSNTVQLDRHFSFSNDRNVYMAVGCDISARVADTTSEKEVGCSSVCLLPDIFRLGICMGYNGCCQISIPIESRSYSVRINDLNTRSTCFGALIVEKDYPLNFLFSWKNTENFPVALNWIIGLGTCNQARERGDSLCGQNSYCIDSTTGHGYNCRCLEGYRGNPYLPDGCKDNNRCVELNRHPCQKGELCVNTPGSYECIPQHEHKKVVWGIIAIVIGLLALSTFGYLVFIRRENKSVKLKFFIRNGGNLLKQHISTNKSSVIKIKMYTSEEMEKATESFSRKRILGKGGQGTVYKGLLSGGTIVAIKKSNAVNKDQVEQFVNELLILAQINHRNIVKLLGCCLEYEVPLLVYEYLSNGTLSEHLFDGEEVSKFSWKERIRIAKEVAEALAYLHSYASSVIFHRDIKPVNILLDENYISVLSDFGLSRSIPLSRTHLTTQVEGTFGYLDPKFFHSGKFTAKSDVYAFGVVLTELLTRKKPISTVAANANEGLIPRFQYLMKHNRVCEILDKQITNEPWTDEVLLVAKLAQRCMKRNIKKRPSMKEVLANLDKIRLVRPEVPSKSVINHLTLTL